MLEELAFVRLRPTPGAQAAIAELDARCFTDAWSTASWARDLERPHLRVWVATQAGRTLAFCCVSVVGEFAELRRIGVDPSVRRAGVGRWLLERAVACLRDEGAERLALEVRSSNSAARGLYAALGFEVDRVRPQYYRKPTEDGVDMSLQL